MKSLTERRERIEIEQEVLIPTLDGKAVAETIKVKVPAWRDPKDGEVYLDGDALELLDRAKARHLGLLTPEQIKQLRLRLGLTQKQISELLQIGQKTWTRWETGRERPSRVINVLLWALNDGRIDAAYLHDLARRHTNREIARDLTARGPFPPLSLPSVSFLSGAPKAEPETKDATATTTAPQSPPVAAP
jgi:DNA-binding transcriptional regulator YiaG